MKPMKTVVSDPKLITILENILINLSVLSKSDFI